MNGEGARVARRVLKWEVPVDDRAHLIGGGPVVLVACQATHDVVQVWTEETEGGGFRDARVYGTGREIPPFAEHLGSVVTAGGSLVWHAYGQRAEHPSTTPERTTGETDRTSLL